MDTYCLAGEHSRSKGVVTQVGEKPTRPDVREKLADEFCASKKPGQSLALGRGGLRLRMYVLLHVQLFYFFVFPIARKRPKRTEIGALESFS